MRFPKFLRQPQDREIDHPPPYAPRDPNDAIAAPPEGQHWTEAHGDLGGYNGDMHPLIAAAFHNKTKNPLCRLPESILLRMMKTLDPVSIECLRRCSRIFLALFPDICTSPAQYIWCKRYPWPVSLLPLRPEEKVALLSQLSRDSYCNDCYTARQRSDWQERLRSMTEVYLHCSGCSADHPVCLFSAQERQKPCYKRLCIGHEGLWRVCEHKTISWQQVVAQAVKQTRRVDWKSDLGLQMVTCGDRSHVVHCSRLSSFFAKRTWCDHFPTLRTYCYGIVGDKRFLELETTWSGHINHTVQASELHHRLGRLEEQAGRFICPRATPGKGAAASLCDPNDCDWVCYPGRKSTGYRRPHSAKTSNPVCHRDRVFSLSKQIKKHEVVSSSFTHSSGRYCWYNDRNPFGIYGGPHLSAEVVVCPKSNTCLNVGFRSSIVIPCNMEGIPSSMSRNWLQVLDPDSYRLTEDKEGFGIYWCKSETCQNYYRFNRSRLNPIVKDYWHACPESMKDAPDLDLIYAFNQWSRPDFKNPSKAKNVCHEEKKEPNEQSTPENHFKGTGNSISLPELLTMFPRPATNVNVNRHQKEI